MLLAVLLEVLPVTGCVTGGVTCYWRCYLLLAALAGPSPLLAGGPGLSLQEDRINFRSGIILAIAIAIAAS